MVAMFPPPFSSGERIVNMTVKNILEEKFDVDILNVSTGRLNPKKFGIQKITNQLLSVWLYIKAIAQVRRQLKKYNYKAFYFVTPSSSFGHIRDYCMIKRLDKRAGNIYAFIHNGNFDSVLRKKFHRKISEAFVSKVDKFVFLSNGLQSKVDGLIEPSKCTVIRNSIGADVIFTDEEIDNKIGTHTGKLNIAYISNMNPTKGYMDLAIAVNLLVKMGEKNIRANFIGEWLSDEQLDAFNTFIKDNNLEDIIIVHGKINDRKKIRALLLASDVFVLPTYFSQEAQPLSIIEALNAGTPVISTRHASIPEYITDGYNGFLVSKQAPEEIAYALQKLFNIDQWKKMASNARSSFTEQFSLEVYKQNLFTLFQ